MAQVTALVADPKLKAGLLYDCACVCALALQVKSEAANTERYRDHSVALLRRARADCRS